MTHALRVPALLVLFVAMLAGCTGAPTVSAGDVEEQARQEFAEQFPVESVDCTDDLPAEVGASITCVLVSEDQSFEMTATTTEVEGEDASFDLELTAEISDDEATDDEATDDETTDDEMTEDETTS